MSENNNVEADQKVVADGTMYMLDMFTAFIAERAVSAADAFMIGHNFHRMVVQTVADQLHPQQNKTQTYHMADMTWRKTIKDMRETARLEAKAHQD